MNFLIEMYCICFSFCIILVCVVAIEDDDVWTRIDDVIYAGPSVVMEGDSFEIQCIMSIFDAPRWTRNDHVLDESERIIFVHMLGLDQTRMLKLVIFNSTAFDSGIYRCNSFSRSFHRVNVISNQKFSFETERQSEGIIFNEILQENSTVILECPNSIESATVYWYKNGFLVNEDSKRKVIENKLIISEANHTDAGDYMCKVDHVSASGGSLIGQMIQLRAPIRVLPFEKVKSVVLSRKVTLQCKYTGYPLGRITWRIGNEILTPAIAKQRNIELLRDKEQHPEAILNLNNITFSDENRYTCVVENQFTSDEASTFIKVRPNDIQTNADPNHNGLLITEQRSLTITCNFSAGDGHPNYNDFTWTKDNGALEIDDRIVVSGGSITISSSKKEDIGDYTCRYNPTGISATIKARMRPKPLPFENFHKTSFRSANIIEGEKLELKCVVPTELSRDVNITWHKIAEEDYDIDYVFNLTDVEGDAHLSITANNSESTLTIEHVRPSDRAYYICKADNGVAIANNTILLRIKDKLGALWPFLGIVGEVIILCTIIFIYEKRRVKPDFDESDADHNMETKTLQDRTAKSQEIRQRK